MLGCFACAVVCWKGRGREMGCREGGAHMSQMFKLRHFSPYIQVSLRCCSGFVYLLVEISGMKVRSQIIDAFLRIAPRKSIARRIVCQSWDDKRACLDDPSLIWQQGTLINQDGEAKRKTLIRTLIKYPAPRLHLLPHRPKQPVSYIPYSW